MKVTSIPDLKCTKDLLPTKHINLRKCCPVCGYDGEFFFNGNSFFRIYNNDPRTLEVLSYPEDDVPRLVSEESWYGYPDDQIYVPTMKRTRDGFHFTENREEDQFRYKINHRLSHINQRKTVWTVIKLKCCRCFSIWETDPFNFYTVDEFKEGRAKGEMVC